MHSENSHLEAMTLNERLFELGIADAFDSAIRSGAREVAEGLLERALIPPVEADETISAILLNPSHYGY